MRMNLQEAIKVCKKVSKSMAVSQSTVYDRYTIIKAIDTVVAEVENPLPTDDCTHPFNEVDRCEGIIYFCNVCKKYVYKNEAI